MKDLSAHIEYLLLRQPEVCLPGLGRLKVKVLPAKYSEEEHAFFPPSRNVLFEADNSVADTSLQMFMAQRYHLSQDMARALVTNYVADLRESLITQGEADMGSIGQFLQDEDGQITFSPCEAGIAAPDFFALDVVEAHFLSQSDVENRNCSDMDKDYITIRISRKAVRRTLRIAATILVAFILVVPGIHVFEQYNIPNRLEAGFDTLYKVMLTPRSTSTVTVQEADAKQTVNTGKQQNKQTQEQTIQLESQPEAVLSEDKQTGKQTDNQQQTYIQTYTEDTKQSEAEIKTQGVYCIVLASSTTEQHAESFIEKLHKMGITDAIIVAERNGRMCRVILPGFATEEQAIIKARELRDQSDDLYDIWTTKL